jgi:hypothetical protein
MSRIIRLAGALALAATLGACDSSSGPANQGSAVSLAIATRPGVAAPAPGGPQLSGAPVTYDDGTNVLVINSVEMVVKEVELKRSEFPSQCDSTATEDQCEELESGPYLLDLPLTGGATSVVTVDVIPGTYDEFEFKIHKPSDDAENAAFLAAHPDFDGVSIRVTGTWNGVAFTYESDLDAEQEQALVPPLVVTETGTADFTLLIDIGTWFRTSGNMLIDPSSANNGGPNENAVRNNIENSFQSFEDENHDGEDDHSGEG